MTKDEFRQLCKTAWEKQHEFVIIDLSSKKNNGKYRSGLDGGFLPALAGWIPFITGTVLPALGVEALSGLASTGVQN